MSTAREEDVPELIYDSRTQITYKRGNFFGRGGFAKCYEITEIARGHVYAGKVISKKLLDKHNQREKICQEIRIHKTLEHKHVVGYRGFFEDNANIYIILELYRKRSLMELHKRRSVLTEPETRYYMKQILDGVKYLHENRIIHRDLKLGNLFLSEDMLVKIGDFGLATRMEYEGERKKTLCGTPNYIAPEILTKKGHSYEVDIWSSGCIMYTLLIGRPPFETKTLKETYARIKRCEYSLSHRLNPSAAHMIAAMLQTDPCKRPTVFQLLKHEFFNEYTPSTLPPSSLIMAPRFDHMIKELNKLRKPLSEVNAMGSNVSQEPTNPSVTTLKDPVIFNAYENLKTLRDNLRKLLSTKPGRSEKLDLDDMADPQAQPIFWVSKWVDYSDKYGFGYQLNDESVGVMFNDSTKIIMLSNGVNIHYINNECKETYMTADSYPPELDSKIKLLSHFSRYMRDHLMKAGAAIIREPDVVSRIPHLHQWCRTTSSVIMHLTNGSLQINFHNHTKIILCPLMSAVTYIDINRDFRTFRFSTIEEYGCSMDLYRSLRYTHDKINMMLEKTG